MPKIKMPKSAPSIDMTPMVDLAFLLVTFFMLSANFRSDEPFTVNTPSSISDKEVPVKRLIQVSIDKDGFIYFGATGEKTRTNMIKDMAKKYGMPLSEKQVKAFIKTSSFGCSMADMATYLKMGPEERKSKKGWGIPCDPANPNANNELQDWIYFAYAAALAEGRDDLTEDSKKTTDKLDANEYKPIFVLKVDGKAHYSQAKRAIDTFRKLEIYNLHFVTSLETNPNQKPE